MSKPTFDPTIYNTSINRTFSDVLEDSISRRSLLKRGSGLAALSFLSGTGLFGCVSEDDEEPTQTILKPNPIQEEPIGLKFDSIPGSLTDACTIAEGYQAQVLAPWGTPLNDKASAWLADGSNSSEDQANSVGMHHDGMNYFPLEGSNTDGLLCINHEFIDQDALHPSGATADEAGNRTEAEEIRKEINAHGVSIVRIQRNQAGEWSLIPNDDFNRRFTGATEMDITGPLANHPSLITLYAPDGNKTRGTLNNCGSGITPWGTFLTCEENWPGYFVNTEEQTAEQLRLGIGDENTRYGWDDLAGDASEIDDEFRRFNVAPSADTADQDYRNEANGFGYIVEIDPYNPASRAAKRTALGRFRHEVCVTGKLTEGQPVVFYSGHDGRFEYLYRFVSTALWDPADLSTSDRLAVGRKYMDEGTLYVAQFDENGTGTWLPLIPESTTTDGNTLGDSFSDLAAIILNTPGAADLVGATKMDRPEWIAVDPISGSIYLTLTNNTERNEEAGTNPANPRLENKFGHIIRWDEQENNTFSWEIFVFGAPDDGDANVNLSGLTSLNQFASPDGLAFDNRGVLWVQTDNGADEVEEETNDQMLAIIPSQLETTDNENQSIITANNQEALKRFFVGPNGCEVTGITNTEDFQSFFVNIQHPGNWPFSNNALDSTPTEKTVRPRAATVVIQKNDGGEVGM